MKTIKGELELDKERGVIRFNDENGVCRLRVSDIARDAMDWGFIDINPEKKKFTCRVCGLNEVPEYLYACLSCVEEGGGRVRMCPQGDGNDESTKEK